MCPWSPLSMKEMCSNRLGTDDHCAKKNVGTDENAYDTQDIYCYFKNNRHDYSLSSAFLALNEAKVDALGIRWNGDFENPIL